MNRYIYFQVLDFALHCNALFENEIELQQGQELGVAAGKRYMHVALVRIVYGSRSAADIAAVCHCAIKSCTTLDE